MLNPIALLSQKIHRHLANLRLAGNVGTLRQLYRPHQGRQDLTVRFQGRSIPVRVRGGSIDLELIRLILREDSEYRLPVSIQPRVIFDVGANIGITALYFACVYPKARIYCFEPLPDNVELLRYNTASFGNRITVIPKGLSNQIGSFPYRRSNDPVNFGGGGFHRLGHDQSQTLSLPVTTAGHVCRELGIRQVDVFKIDTEGAELAVLQGIPLEILNQASALIGELHGVEDYAFLERLSQAHHVGVWKPHDRQCYPFVAVRKQTLGVASLAQAG
jgi:FkbM family methyltransferase